MSDIPSLLHETVATPPPGLDVDLPRVLREGHRRRRTRRTRRVVTVGGLALVGGAVAVALAAHPDATRGRSTDQAPGTHSTPAPARDVDPQVLSDVEAGVLMMPGPSMLQTMRIQQFVTGQVNIACGGGPLPLDDTSGRFAQNEFPDLSLIAAKGFVEPRDPSEHLLVPHAPGCEQATSSVLPAWQPWENLQEPWNNAAGSAKDSAAVRRTLPGVAACLQRESGEPVSAKDPIDAVFDLADGGAYAADSKTAQKDVGIMLGGIYADCTPAYFDALADQLRPQRTRLIAENQGLLEDFARQVTAAGYVPLAGVKASAGPQP